MTELIDGLPWWWALPLCIIFTAALALDIYAERARARRRARRSPVV